MKDNMELTLREICNYVACMNSLVEHKIVSFNPDNAYLEFCEEGAIRFLEEQNLKQKEKIERLNNIINELEKDLEDRYYGRGKYNLSTDIVGIPTFLNRIKEIKGSDKE